MNARALELTLAASGGAGAVLAVLHLRRQARRARLEESVRSWKLEAVPERQMPEQLPALDEGVPF